MKNLIIFCIIAFVPMSMKGQEGVRFESTRLTSEESGYVRIFGDQILSITTHCYNSYRHWMMSRIYADLGDPGNSKIWVDSALEEARASRAKASSIVSDLEYYIPPPRFEKLHEVLHEFAKDKMKPIEERAPTCRDVYCAANDLKHDLLRSPSIWVPNASPPVPMDLVFIPIGLPVRYNLTKGTFALGHAIATPVGTFAFSMPLTSTKGVQRESAQLVSIEYDGRARLFALDRSINIQTQPDNLYVFRSFGHDSNTGVMKIVVTSLGLMPTNMPREISEIPSIPRAVPVNGN